MTACNGYLTTTATGTQFSMAVPVPKVDDRLWPASGQHAARASQVDQKGDVPRALVAITRKYLRNLLRQASPDGDHSNQHGPTDILDRTRAQKLREPWSPGALAALES
ncbi:hypothetical protein PG997_002452 [Apiospora hydei]|uniref:Uncharacterized protein n=1 Tax=Apiospora hydei TaxID=1337664 RepID=A0ABR1X9D1_9PEZI